MNFKALYCDSVTLYLINDDNVDTVYNMLQGLPDCDELTAEIKENYLPEYEKGVRVKYGFYAMFDGNLVGFSLLSVDDIKECKGSTGADTLLHMRGKEIAPRSKPHLFYLGFELLGLNRIETGCLVTNIASKRSIEKTAGFQFEGTMRESGLNDQGEFEDQYLYAILRKDWVKLYDKSKVRVEY